MHSTILQLSSLTKVPTITVVFTYKSTNYFIARNKNIITTTKNHKIIQYFKKEQ